jgi:hypothetical protein
MDGNITKFNDDLVELHPELSMEELDKLIEEEKKRCEELTEWPKM